MDLLHIKLVECPRRHSLLGMDPSIFQVWHQGTIQDMEDKAAIVIQRAIIVVKGIVS